MLDSIYHMTSKLLKNPIFWRENVTILSSVFRSVIMDIIT